MSSQLDVALEEAAGWIADCTQVRFSHTDRGDQVRIIGLTHANFEGGWPAFINADPSLAPEVVWLLMVRRFGIEFANRYNP